MLEQRPGNYLSSSTAGHALEHEVLVAVLTTGQRAETLEQCLSHLRALDIPEDITFHFLLVQNGIERPTLTGDILTGDHVRSSEVIAEPKRGIPPARNAALQYAHSRGIPWLAFMDDDAFADPDWLARLTRPISDGRAEAVSGPQIPVFDATVTDSRLRASKVYRERRLKDGASCSWAATNNVVFSVRFAHEHGLKFNEAMTSGGSDKEFFLRFNALGGRIRWASAAVVREYVDASRLSLGWIARREWRKGATEYQMLCAVASVPKAVSLCFAKSGYYTISGLRNLALSALPGQPGHVDAMADFSHALGLLAGLVPGLRPRTYT